MSSKKTFIICLQLLSSDGHKEDSCSAVPVPVPVPGFSPTSPLLSPTTAFLTHQIPPTISLLQWVTMMRYRNEATARQSSPSQLRDLSKSLCNFQFFPHSDLNSGSTSVVAPCNPVLFSNPTIFSDTFLPSPTQLTGALSAMANGVGGANGGGSGGGTNKPEPLQPHPVMEQLGGVQYCINSPPPWLDAVMLAFQHYLLSLGTIALIPSMLVPQMGGGFEEKVRVIQTLLLTSGLSTLLQSIFGTRLPTIATGSYAFLIPTISIIQARRYEKIQDPIQRFSDTIRGIQGAIMVAGAFQLFLGALGIWRNFVKFFNPLSVVPLISFTGLGLCYFYFSKVAECLAVGFPALIAFFAISQFVPQLVAGKGRIWDRYAVLFSILLIWFYACVLTWSGAYKNSRDVLNTCRTDRSGLISAAPWIYVPLPFQWGPPTFNATEALAMIFASLVASMESTGTFLAAARYGSATPVPSSVLSRGIGWMGVGTTMGGLLGSLTGSTASVENAGALALTRVGSRRVVQISATFMIFFSLFGKFGAIFASIPFSIVAAMNCILLGCVSSSGLSHLQFCNLNSFRTKFILACSFALGLSVPQYFRESQLISNHSPVNTHAQWFNDIITVMFMSHATVAGLVALFMDCALPRGTDQNLKDSGKHWWEKFFDYNKDVRSDEFYRLPCQLNSFWPPL